MTELNGAGGPSPPPSTEAVWRGSLLPLHVEAFWQVGGDWCHPWLGFYLIQGYSVHTQVASGQRENYSISGVTVNYPMSSAAVMTRYSASQ